MPLKLSQLSSTDTGMGTALRYSQKLEYRHDKDKAIKIILFFLLGIVVYGHI